MSSKNASCGVCLVEVKGARSLVRACTACVFEGIEIITNSARIRDARKTNVELLLANHPKDCLSCLRNQNCELQEIAAELGVMSNRFVQTRKQMALDASSPSLVRDPNKCILCGRCIAVCGNVQTVHAIGLSQRGIRTRISTYMEKGLGNVACTNCGQCALVCPTAAIVERDDTDEVFEELMDPEKVVVVQTAPAIRVGIGEAMGMAPGALVTGQMVAGLRRLGFNKVFDTQFTADLTIMEEAHELLHRIKNKGALPMVTSCSPGWIKFAEHFFPDALPHLSTCKSPQQMFGAIAKTYYANKMGIDPRKMVVVSVMPCTAKKYEARRPEMMSAFEHWKEKRAWSAKDEFYDVDYVLTTRELGRMFKESGIQFASLPAEEFDHPLGESTGAAVIFGSTGGVMEAALRTAYEVVTGTTLTDLNFTAVRGMEGIKEAEVDLKGTTSEGGRGPHARKRQKAARADPAGRIAVRVHRSDELSGRMPGRRRTADPDDVGDTAPACGIHLRRGPRQTDTEVAREPGRCCSVQGSTEGAARRPLAPSSPYDVRETRCVRLEDQWAEGEGTSTREVIIDHRWSGRPADQRRAAVVFRPLEQFGRDVTPTTRGALQRSHRCTHPVPGQLRARQPTKAVPREATRGGVRSPRSSHEVR